MDLDEVLLKKASGYAEEEVTEEYTEEDGRMKLVKRKVVQKKIPPDLASIKAVLERQNGMSELSDAQLESELKRLKKELCKKIKEDKNADKQGNKV